MLSGHLQHQHVTSEYFIMLMGRQFDQKPSTAPEPYSGKILSLSFSTRIDSRCAHWILDILRSEEGWTMTCWVTSMESGIYFLQSQRSWPLISILLPSKSPLFLVISLSLRRTPQILSSPNLDQQQCEHWGIIMSSLYNLYVQHTK